MQFSAFSGHLETCRLLVEYDADIHARDRCCSHSHALAIFSSLTALKTRLHRSQMGQGRQQVRRQKIFSQSRRPKLVKTSKTKRLKVWRHRSWMLLIFYCIFDKLRDPPTLKRSNRVTGSQEEADPPGWGTWRTAQQFLSKRSCSSDFEAGSTRVGLWDKVTILLHPKER